MENLLAQSSISISYFDLTISLVVALLLGLLSMFIYKHIQVSASYDKSYEFSLIIIPSIVCVIMIFIGSNLALSIGLVGSLSIIRFRTVIKNTMDMVFLFWSIAIGLGCGTYNWQTIIYFSFFISIFIIFINIYLQKKSKNNFYDTVLVINANNLLDSKYLKDVILKYNTNFNLRSIERGDKSSEYIYHLFNNKINSQSFLIESLVEEINALEDVNKVSILSPEVQFNN